MAKFHTTIGEDAYRNVLLQHVTTETQWLDLGCGWRLLREWLPDGDRDQSILSRRARFLVGIDAVVPDVDRNPYIHAKVAGDLHHLPFRNSSFSLITAQMVVEHIDKPLSFLREVRRVLKPGGMFIFLTPNYLNYQVFAASLVPERLKKRIVLYLEWRAEDDVFETYYRMNTKRDIRRLALDSGFNISEINMLHQAWEFRRVPLLHLIERGLFRLLDRRAFSGYRPEILVGLVKPRGETPY